MKVAIDYTNYRGERRAYNIIPQSIYWGSNRWHPLEQWLLTATDVDRGVTRDFAMAHIHSWEPVT